MQIKWLIGVIGTSGVRAEMPPLNELEATGLPNEYSPKDVGCLGANLVGLAEQFADNRVIFKFVPIRRLVEGQKTPRDEGRAHNIGIKFRHLEQKSTDALSQCVVELENQIDEIYELGGAVT